MKLASCTPSLNSLESAMQNYRTEVVQTSGNCEALEKRVAMIEDIPVHARLREIRADLRKTNEEIATLRGNWDAAAIRLQELDSEVANLRAHIQATSQELTVQLTDH